MTYYKVLNADRTPCHGGKGQWHPQAWMPIINHPEPCVRGYHLCRREDLVYWLGATIWEAKAGDIIIPDSLFGPKTVTEKARLIRRFETWNVRIQRLFAADCAEHVLHWFEEKYSGDGRPRQTVEMARRFADGEATAAELEEAADAAWAATYVAGYTARYAARAAAYTARSATWHAARSAAWAAADAADAARSATWYSAYAAERDWQTSRLFDYLEGRAG